MKMMREDVLRKLFCKKLHDELELFHLRKLRERPEEIYRSSYEIESKINIYEGLMELIERMDADTLGYLLDINDVLDCFYKQWTKDEDTMWDQMKASIIHNIRDIKEASIKKERMSKAYEKIDIRKRVKKRRLAS